VITITEKEKTVDFTKDYRNNWLNTIIKQINTCEFEIYNVDAYKKSIARMVRAERGLLALLDGTGKEKFKDKIQLLYAFEENNRWVKSYEEIERLHSDVMTYLNATIFKDLGGYRGIDIAKEGVKL
jgi:hypothetical protein